MSALVIVQVRMDSQRLPGKALMDLHGKPVLQHVIERAQAAGIGDVVVATTSRPVDKPIMDLAQALGLEVYGAWEPDDVLRRFVRTAEALGPDAQTIVRVTADCPLLDPGLLAQVARKLERGRFDYVGVKGAADGYHQEALSLDALKLSDRLATDPYDREHVVTFALKRPAMFRIGWVQADMRGEPVTLDTAEDMERLRALLERMAA